MGNDQISRGIFSKTPCASFPNIWFWSELVSHYFGKLFEEYLTYLKFFLLLTFLRRAHWRTFAFESLKKGLGIDNVRQLNIFQETFLAPLFQYSCSKYEINSTPSIKLCGISPQLGYLNLLTYGVFIDFSNSQYFLSLYSSKAVFSLVLLPPF